MPAKEAAVAVRFWALTVCRASAIVAPELAAGLPSRWTMRDLSASPKLAATSARGSIII